MKKLICIVCAFAFTAVLQAQVLNIRKIPTLEMADEFKTQTLVIIKLQTEAEKAEKMQKKDPEQYKVYQGSVDVYNKAASTYGPSMKGIFADVKYLTIDEISKLKEAEMSSYAFMFPYAITTGGTSYYEEMQYNLYKRADWALLKENFAKITDFSMSFSKGKYEKGDKKHFQWGMFSRETVNGKTICGWTYGINFPLTEAALTEADMVYLYKTTKNTFERIVKNRTSDLKATEDNAAMKSKKMYVCSNNFGTDFTASTFGTTYKGKAEVISKEEYDKKLMAGEDALFLVVYPWFYVKGITAMLAKSGYAHVVIDGKSFEQVKNYAPNKVVTGKMENISFDADFRQVSAKTTEEYNKAF